MHANYNRREQTHGPEPTQVSENMSIAEEPHGNKNRMRMAKHQYIHQNIFTVSNGCENLRSNATTQIHT